jgi:hypothetical protein
MPKTLLVPFVICGLLLTTSCSSTDAKACDATQQTVEDDTNKVQELLLSSKDLDKMVMAYRQMRLEERFCEHQKKSTD